MEGYAILPFCSFYFFIFLGIAIVRKKLFSIPSWIKVIDFYFGYYILTLTILFEIYILYVLSDYLVYLFPNMYYYEIYNFCSSFFKSLLFLTPLYSFYLLIIKYKNQNFLKTPLLNLLVVLTGTGMYDLAEGNGFYRTYFLRDYSSPQFGLLCWLIMFTVLFMFSDINHRKKITKFFPILYIFIEIALLLITLNAIIFKIHSQLTGTRIAALGYVFLLLILLLGILFNYIGFLFRKKELIHIQKWVFIMIPPIAVWLPLTMIMKFS